MTLIVRFLWLVFISAVLQAVALGSTSAAVLSGFPQFNLGVPGQSPSVLTSISVGITIAPKSATLVVNQQLQFTATLTGTTSTAVNWSISGAGCSGTSCGTVNASGLYTAPAAVPNPAQVTVTVTSVNDSTKSASAAVTVVPPVVVTVSPKTAQVMAGSQTQFSATISGTINTAVTWSIKGSGCSGSTCGTITAAGSYTAPGVVPSPAQVTITATSVADHTKSASATVTVIPPVMVTISPKTAQVIAGARRQFSALVSGIANTGVTWSIKGAGCVSGACGTITAAGLYTAASAVPTPALLTVTATSVADTAKSASATVTIVPPVAVAVSPKTALVVIGTKLQFTAKVTGTTNPGVKWGVRGAGCSGNACGTISSAGLYTAPNIVPTPAQVTVTAISLADSTKSSSATLNIVPPIAVTVSPSSLQVMAGSQQQFTANVKNTTNTGVVWSVSGAGCSGGTCGTISTTGLYTAPSGVPTPPQIAVTATSVADSSKSASATATVIAAIVVTVLPKNTQVTTGAKQQFRASISGATNTGVTWSIKGSGCAGAACGTITAGGLYTAPTVIPTPAQLTVTATSLADSAKSASATVTVVLPIVVTVSPKKAQVTAGTQRDFTATVTGTTNLGVAWSLGGAGCSGSGCGKITAAGLYSAPNVVPTPAQVTVTATSAADSTKSASATITLIAAPAVRLLPAATAVSVNGQQQFLALIEGKNAAMNWSLSGAGCTGTACGTISSTGLYKAPSKISTPLAVTVEAVSQSNLAELSTAAVTVVASNNGKFVGQYAFFFTGFDAQGVYEAAGTITADGAGNLTSGSEDVNRLAGPAVNVPITGTYDVGDDNRADMRIASNIGSQTFKVALNQPGTKGRFIEFDDSGIRGSGVVERQDPSAFGASSLSGGYVLGLTGKDNVADRIAMIGVMYPNGSGSVSAGSIDVNDAGVLSPTIASLHGTYKVDPSGRGTASLSIPGFAGGSFTFAFYVISTNKLLMVSIDPLSANNPIFAGSAELQSGAPFLTSEFNGPAVFGLGGESDRLPEGFIGWTLFDGQGTLRVAYDRNIGGSITSKGSFNGAYDVELNGRGTLNLDNPFTQQSSTWVMYATGPNQAFLMDVSSKTVLFGELNPQESGPNFFNGNILGNYVLGSGEPIEGSDPLYSGESNFDGGSSGAANGIVSGVLDASLATNLSPDAVFSGVYLVSREWNNGLTATTLKSSNLSNPVLWVISPTEALGLDIDPSNSQPVVLHFEQ
jgi:Fe-S cluster assembly iron-binding protein IscA